MYKKKYLIVLAGSPRGGKKTWNSLIENVLDHLDADLAICTTDNFYIKNNVLYKRASYKWIMDNPKKFEDYYEKYFYGYWKKYLKKGKGLGLFESGKIHFALKDFVYRFHQETLNKYEYIIYSRFDQFHFTKHPDFNEDKLYIPEGEDYFGYCDRHVIFKSINSEKYFSIIDFIDSEKAFKNLPKYMNCESVYKSHLIEVGLDSKIERYKRTSFTVALKNEPTNWRIPTYKIFFSKNLMIKYPDEFKQTVRNYLTKFKFRNLLTKNLNIILYYFYLTIRNHVGHFFNRKINLLCEVHGEMFLSERYQDLKFCPECENKN